MMSWTDHRCGPHVNVYLQDEADPRVRDLVDKISEEMTTACDEVAKRYIDLDAGIDIVVS